MCVCVYIYIYIYIVQVLKKVFKSLEFKRKYPADILAWQKNINGFLSIILRTSAGGEGSLLGKGQLRVDG